MRTENRSGHRRRWGPADSTTNRGEKRETGFLKRFTGMAVGDNEITVDVSDEDENDRQTFRVVVRRGGPNLDNESERQQFFHESLRGGNVEGLSLAMAHGADPDGRFGIGRGVEGTALSGVEWPAVMGALRCAVPEG